MRTLVLLVMMLLGCSSEPAVVAQGGACLPAPTDQCAAEGEGCTTPFEGRAGLCVAGDEVDGAGRCKLVCCAGCIQDGLCVPGDADDACGFAGHACAPCSAPMACNWDGICK